MSRRRRPSPQLELDDLPPEVYAALEAAIAGDGITLTRSGRPIGSLEFRSIVLQGTVVDSPARPTSPAPIPDGVTVVATAMSLSENARRRLSDEFGCEYIVLDITEAPSSAEVLLVHPVSPQLVGLLRRQFPDARVVIAEIEDDDLDVHYPGPVSRLLEAGASTYLPPRPIAELATTVRAYLARSHQPALDPSRGTRATQGLSATERRRTDG